MQVRDLKFSFTLFISPKHQIMSPTSFRSGGSLSTRIGKRGWGSRRGSVVNPEGRAVPGRDCSPSTQPWLQSPRIQIGGPGTHPRRSSKPQQEGQGTQGGQAGRRTKTCRCVSVYPCVCVCCPWGHKAPSGSRLTGWRGAIKVGGPSPGLSLKLGRRKGKTLCCEVQRSGWRCPSRLAAPEHVPKFAGTGSPPSPPLPQARPLPAPGLLRLGGFRPGPDLPLGCNGGPTPHFRMQTAGLGLRENSSRGRAGSRSLVFLSLRG